MFDTMKIAQNIKTARIARNMTQMNLADEMNVSYQAVSNWERGNSMPDISKLEQLCSILQISIDELLGNSPENHIGKEALNKAILAQEQAAENPGSAEDFNLSIKELSEIAPLLPPKAARHFTEKAAENEPKINLSAIIPLAPFLDTEYLDSLISRVEIQNLQELNGIIPFLSRQALDGLAERVVEADLPGLNSIAPFLSHETLDRLVMRILTKENGDLSRISGLAPFLSKKTLRQIADTLMKSGDFKALQSIMPFC